MPDSETAKHAFLPDLCRVPAVFFLVLVGELLALVIVLLQQGLRDFSWSHLGIISLYIQWIVLLNGAALCYARRLLLGRPTAQVAAASFAVVMLVTTVVSVTSRALLPGAAFDPLDSLADVLVAAILAGIALRYFYLQFELRQQQQAELQARLDALQARMRPHFLFNSMNTIAGMIAVDPDAAEEMIEDLACLFRGAMTSDRVVSMEEDIGFARSYMHIEQRRLGDRLRVEWDLPPGLDSVRVPVLLFQPLLENAVYHGVQPLADGGTVRVEVEKWPTSCRIRVINPLVPADAGAAHVGQGMALENTRRRLEALYSSRAKLEAGPRGGDYVAEIELPLEAQ